MSYLKVRSDLAVAGGQLDPPPTKEEEEGEVEVEKEEEEEEEVDGVIMTGNITSGGQLSIRLP